MMGKVTNLVLVNSILQAMFSPEGKLNGADPNEVMLNDERNFRIAFNGNIITRNRINPSLLREFEIVFDGRWYKIIPNQSDSSCYMYNIQDMGDVDFLRRLVANFNKLSKKHKPYCSFLSSEMVSSCTMMKTFNRGTGALELWNINVITREILINTLLFNRCDEKNFLSMVYEVPELASFDVYGVRYGYPDYYNFGFTSPTVLSKREKISI